MGANVSDTVEKAIIIVAELFLFITACMFTIGGINAQEAAITTIRQATEQEERHLYTSLQVNGKETYTGAEVLQSIQQIHNLNANIRVGNQFFSKSLELEVTDVSGVNLDKIYDVSYVRDGMGIVTTIVFT
ncbi:hypothetical protein PGLA_20345 [Paenibacillus glacialis]|uniref:Uncharacterized protein n=1 Tax=Paenibacillus glacialis TaxID=494026 RepID=A0A168HR53_9BACL|nr:hypothetical protein PGLA_20345 [Paenibacillus glacialis]